MIRPHHNSKTSTVSFYPNRALCSQIAGFLEGLGVSKSRMGAWVIAAKHIFLMNGYYYLLSCSSANMQQ